MQIRSIAYDLIDKYSERLDQMSIEFARRVFSTPHEIYINRLKAISFEGMGKILDFGCGFGQWSIALATLNLAVEAHDSDLNRLYFLNDLVDELKFKNFYIIFPGFSHLLWRDQEDLDGIFCYGVLPLLPWKRILSRFYEILKPDAKLYLTANGLGWYLHLWKNQPNKTKDYNPRKWVAQTFMNTVGYEDEGIYCSQHGNEIVIEEGDLLKELEKTGFDVIACGDEGSISLTGQTTESFFRGEYEGHRGVYEVLCRKR